MVIPLKPKRSKAKTVAPQQPRAFAGLKTGSSVHLHEQISERAYEIYQSGGHTDGRDQQDWFRAERELLAAREQMDQGK